MLEDVGVGLTDEEGFGVGGHFDLADDGTGAGEFVVVHADVAVAVCGEPGLAHLDVEAGQGELLEVHVVVDTHD